MNGTQLYGISKLAAVLRMGFNRELKGLSLKKKLALNYVSKESKLTLLNNRIFSNTFTPYFPSHAYDRFLKGVKAISSGYPIPIVTNFAVTAKCPCNCWHCSFADRPRNMMLDFNTLQQAIEDAQELGSSVIGLTGGEPLLRDDLEDIIAAIDDRSMPILFSTGYGLTTERVKALKKAGLEIPVISLDSYNPHIHDQGRRKDGMFDSALRAIRLFREEGFYVAVSFVPDRKLVDNVPELYRTIRFFKDLGVNDMRLTSPILSGRLTEKAEEKLSPENVKTIIDLQKMCTRTPGYPGVFAYDFFENEDYYGCGAGYNYMFIDAEGNVCPCDFTMLSFGNIHDKALGDIWDETSRAFSVPGCSCYANKCSGKMAEVKPDTWPVKGDQAREVLKDCPPYDKKKIPEFYRRMGLHLQKRFMSSKESSEE
ncbi:MAG: radical SAM protein [Proteobacteria bacterium]|nr:radical SAM protein [Pseudomonadota bacterium]